MLGQRHSQPTLTSLGPVCMHACLGVICHLHFWQVGWGLLRATAVTRGRNGRYLFHTDHLVEVGLLMGT